MDERRSESKPSLTGVWEGIYSYPVAGLPVVPFTATLFEAGSLLSGSMHEPWTLPGNEGEMLLFTLTGGRRGSSVDFVKTHDGDHPHFRHAILYAGTVNEDATEIEGRWTIPGDWSGRFLMTRSGRGPQATVKSKRAHTRLETAKKTVPAR